MHMATTLANRIELTFEGAVARVALSHPPVNVIDFAMMDELMSALSTIEQRNEVSTIVLSGTGRGLSAGVDVAIHTPDKIQEMLTKFHGLVLALAKCRKVTIAEVRGVCLGGGAELVMVCDMVYTADATFPVSRPPNGGWPTAHSVRTNCPKRCRSRLTI